MQSFAVIEKQLKELAATRDDLALLVAFGSQVRGDATAASDLDLAVIADDVDSVREAIMRCIRSDAVDVVDLRRASPILAMAIARDGRVIAEKDAGTFSQFASLAFRRFCDTAKLRDHRRAQLDEFVRQRLG